MRILPFFVIGLTGCGGFGLDAEPFVQDADQKAIVGGESANEGQFPHQIALGDDSWGQFCGGSIISSEWVLTAAHCVVGDSPGSMWVEAGATVVGDGFRFMVTEIVVHPAYSGASNGNDMALLRVSGDLTEAGQAIPLVDPSTEFDFAGPGQMATVSGWGTLSSGGGTPADLQYVGVPVVEQEICNDQYGGGIDDTMVCAGFVGVGGADSCQGDSGGPLVVPAGNGWAQNGVVSFGQGCALSSHAGVYARVAVFSSWISSHVPDAVFLSGDTPPPPPLDDHGNSNSDATPVEIDGVMEIGGNLTSGDIDVFKLQVPMGQTIRIFTASDIDTIGTVYDADGAVVVEVDDDAEGNLNFDLSFDAEEGNYYLHVRGWNDNQNGDYDLTIEAEEAPEPVDDHGNDFETATLLTGGGTMTAQGELFLGDTDVFAFELSEGQAVEIFTNSEIDTVGELNDATAELSVINDDDPAGGLNFRIEADVEAGLHYVSVWGYNGEQEGTYQLVVVTTEDGAVDPDPIDDHGETFEDATDILVEDFATGTLTAGDLDAFRIFVDYDGILIAEGLGQVDTVAAIFDADGNQLDYGDDEGPASNFRISQWVTAGTYYVVVGGYNDTAEGEYALSILR